MKKILLSCVTCLLAIGLVTACEDEDEVTGGGGGDSTTQDTGTGGGSDTGTGGGATDVTTLSNYTLELTLTDEYGEDPIPSYATAYIIGDWDNWGEFLPLTGENGVYSYTFESITVGWHNFKGVMWYTDEEVGWEGKCVEIVTVPYVDEETGETVEDGNAYFEVVASQGDGSKCQLKYTVTATLEERIVSVTGVSISEGSSVYVAPEGEVQLHAVVTPSNATDQSVTWAVKEEEGDTEPNDPVVSVDQQTGLVTAGASMGTATIVVTTTDGGYTAETEVYVISAESIIEDYTLTITLGEGVTIPTYAELYLSYNGGYSLLNFEDGTATASLGSVVIGTTISYSVYLDYSEEYRAMEGCPDVTESNIVLAKTHTVVAEETGISEEITTLPSLADPETSYQEVKIQINIYSDDSLTTPTVVPDYLDVYIQWTLDNWENYTTPEIGGSGQLVEDGNDNPYTYIFKGNEVLGPGHVDFTLYYEHNSASSFEWGDYNTKVENLSFDVPYFYDGEAIVINICDWGIAEAIEDLGSDTNFYVVVVDTDSASTLESLEWYGFACANSFTLENSTNYSAGKSATSVDGKLCAYSSSYATVAAGGSEWFSLYATSDWGDEIQFDTISDIPSTGTDTYAILVGYANLSQLGTSGTEGSNKQYIKDTHTWITDIPTSTSIENYIASATLAYSAS